MKLPFAGCSQSQPTPFPAYSVVAPIPYPVCTQCWLAEAVVVLNLSWMFSRHAAAICVTWRCIVRTFAALLQPTVSVSLYFVL